VSVSVSVSEAGVVGVRTFIEAVVVEIVGGGAGVLVGSEVGAAIRVQAVVLAVVPGPLGDLRLIFLLVEVARGEMIVGAVLVGGPLLRGLGRVVGIDVVARAAPTGDGVRRGPQRLGRRRVRRTAACQGHHQRRRYQCMVLHGESPRARM